MCPPALLAIGIVASVVASAVQAYGQYQQSRYQAKIANRNAILAEQDAVTALERGRTEEVKRRIMVAQEIGKQRAQLAASGVVLGGDADMSLSSDLVMADTAMSGEWEALALRWQSSELARRYRLQAQDYRTRARFHIQSGNMAVIGTAIGAVGGIASAASGLGGLGSSTPSTPIGTSGPSFGVNVANINAGVRSSFDVRKFSPSIFNAPGAY